MQDVVQSEFDTVKSPVEDIDQVQKKPLPKKAGEKKEIKKEVSADVLSGKIEPSTHMSQGMETTKDNLAFKNVKVSGGIISGNGRTSVR